MGVNETAKGAIPPALEDCLLNIPKAALAFSGGVDSSFLLYAAKSCGVDVHAYYVNSQFQPQFELEDAQRLAGEQGVDMTVLKLDVLADETVRGNPADRCYHCKRMIVKTILDRAAADGYNTLMDGSNASDEAGERPGMRALAELNVCSPLREAKMTKEQVRACSKQANLFTWDKPAYACLATRVPTDIALSEDLLRKIEEAECALAQMGFFDFRARVMGQAVKLQLPAEQLLLAAQRHEELVQRLSPWFSDVFLDLTPRKTP